MAVAGALIGGALGAFGEKPRVPTLMDINPDLIQKDTVAGNIASLADIAKLATSVNTLNQDQLETLLDRALGPGTREQIQSTIQARLRGELSPGTVNAISRYQAGRNVGALTQGSNFANNAAATQIGLTAEQQIDRGLSSAESWLARAQAPMFDSTAMFFSSRDRLGLAERQQARKFERDMIAAGIKAAPDPATAALGKEIDRFFNTFASVGTMALGGIGGVAKDTGTFGAPGAAQQGMMMQDYGGSSNMGLNYR